LRIVKPSIRLHAEGAAVLITACILYRQSNVSWWWFGLLLLAPDFSMLGYLANPRLGAAVYNLGHTYTAPLLLLSVLWLRGPGAPVWLALIWLAHIGLDRMIGYGWKYETNFKGTHLQHV
jgi:hypothetical protein